MAKNANKIYSYNFYSSKNVFYGLELTIFVFLANVQKRQKKNVKIDKEVKGC